MRIAAAAAVAGTAHTAALGAQERTVAVAGVVLERGTTVPVVAVAVIHANVVVATTDAEGRFTTPSLPVVDGAVTIGFRRIGFTPAVRSIDVGATQTTVTIDVALEAAPTVLREIEVDGEPFVVENPGLVGFYQRRAEDFGRYLTEAEIERGKGFDLLPYMRRLRAPTACSPLIPLAVYLDGIRVTGFDRVNDLIPPNQLGGIEYYGDERRVRLPPEFTPAGPVCGIVLLWTRRPKGPSSFDLGGYVVAQAAGSSTTAGFAGVRIAFPLRSRSSLSLHAAFDGALDDGSDRWRLHLHVTLRPLGYASRWYAGAGITVSKRAPAAVEEPNSSTDAAPALVTGAFATLGPLRPFVEIRAVDPTSPNSAELLIASGVTLHFGPR